MSQVAAVPTRSIAAHDTGRRSSDAALIEAVAAVLTPPRREPADSFVLHSPLELIARAALLPYVEPSARPDARRRLVELGDGYRTASPPAIEPRAVSFDDPGVAAAALVRAIDQGELDDVDAAARWLGRAASARELRQLLTSATIPPRRRRGRTDLPVPAPAGGAAVGRSRLSCFVAWSASLPVCRSGACIGLMNAVARPVPASHATTPDALWDALAAVPQLGPSTSDFIFPLMSRIDTPDQVPKWIGTATAADAGETEAAFRARGRAVLHAAGVVDAPRATRSRTVRMEPLPHDAASGPGHRGRSAGSECRPRGGGHVRRRLPRVARPPPARGRHLDLRPAHEPSLRPRRDRRRTHNRSRGDLDRTGIATRRRS